MYKKMPILLVVLVSYLMIVLDISIVITALPKIKESFDLSSASLSWVQNAYTLAFGGLLLLGARAGDILGRKRMFLLGLIIFTLSSLAITIAQFELWLFIGRAFQGVGAAILAPSTLALLAANFEEKDERTKAVAYYGAVAGIGASLGLVLGGIITAWFSWRIAFFINIPIGIALIIAAKYYIVETSKHTGEFDLIGAITSTFGMTSLVYAIVRSAQNSWNETYVITFFVLGVISLILFVFNERNAKQPIMPLRLFEDRQRSGAYIARILFLGAMMGFWFFTTQYLQITLGFTTYEAGLAFLPMTISNFIVALMVPRLTKKFGNSLLLLLGLFVTLAGMFSLSFISQDSSYLYGIALPMILIGIGQGGSLSPLTVSGVANVEAKDAGSASGVVNVAHQLGASLGLGILVVVFSHAGENISETKELFIHQISTALQGSSVMLVLAIIVVAIFIMKKTNIQK